MVIFKIKFKKIANFSMKKPFRKKAKGKTRVCFHGFRCQN